MQSLKLETIISDLSNNKNMIKLFEILGLTVVFISGWAVFFAILEKLFGFIKPLETKVLGLLVSTSFLAFVLILIISYFLAKQSMKSM